MKLKYFQPLIGYFLITNCPAAVTVSDPSTAWTVMEGNYDYLIDQQTGDPTSDIVGTGTNYGFFVTFDNNGAASATDGTLGFRLRLDAPGGPNNKPEFDRAAWIGIDADIDGDIDVFLGLNLHGSNAEIGIHQPGTGDNTSPNTTSIVSTPWKSYGLTASNYNFRAVNVAIDGGTTNDATTSSTGDPDHYISFMVPFADVVAFLNGRSIAITDQSPLRYVTATSTQTNSLNQDLGGVNGGVNSTTSWVDLGGFSRTVYPSGQPIPEPSTPLALISSLAVSLSLRRRNAR